MTLGPYDNLNEDLQKLFGTASRKQAAARILNDKEWSKIREIEERHAAEQRYQNRCFEFEYKSRFEQARRRLINKAGRPKKDFVNRLFGRDVFDGDTIDRQADRIVRREHARLTDHLERQKDKQIEKLLQRSERQRKLKEKPLRDFNRAADRRSGPDRRQRAGPSR